MSTAIAISGLSKSYILGQRRADGLRHIVEDAVRDPLSLFRRRERSQEEFWALRDVSCDVKVGEAIGVIGQNGSGKSTLLKLLSRVTAPTRGEFRYKGRLASLLEVGTGFHPELTGRENIYLNAAILGMRRADINRRFDEIVAFSEVEQFLDTPVKRYSSGMYVRLAFGVAAHLEPDILVVDEVLAVGDAAFQKKCLGRMGDVVREGRTVLFVSHNMAAVSALCSRAILLRKGTLALSATPEVAIQEYLRTGQLDSEIDLADRKDRQGEGRIRFRKLETLNAGGQPVANVVTGQDVVIAIDYDLEDDRPVGNVTVQLKFAGTFGQPLFACLSSAAQSEPLELKPGGRLLLRIPRLPLMSGLYTCTAWVNASGTLEDLVRDAGKLSVVEGDFFGTGRLPPNTVGDFLLPHAWEVV